MTHWFVSVVGPDDLSGIVSAPDCSTAEWPGIRCFTGGHPVPNDDSVRAASQALAAAQLADEDDVIVFLISGGGSALLEMPVRSTIDLDDLQAMNETLVTCGASIVEINAVRKHVSAVKGGRLARAAFPARQLTVFISDVPDGEDATVASGPTMPDASTVEDAHRVVHDHGLADVLPPSILSVLADPVVSETPKPGDPCFRHSEWIRLLDNKSAIEAARVFAEEQGWAAIVDTSVDEMNMAEAASRLLEHLRHAARSEPDRPVCVISGGELSSPVTGDGTGGRNQAFVLACVPLIAGERIAVMSAGTDGIDGNSPAAGAVADGTTFDRAGAIGIDPEDFANRSDSYSFFHRLGDDITCGATGNNVRDIRVLVAWPESMDA